MLVGQWDGCCYVLRKDLLAERAGSIEAVQFIKLAKDGAQKCMQPASPQELKVCWQET